MRSLIKKSLCNWPFGEKKCIYCKMIVVKSVEEFDMGRESPATQAVEISTITEIIDFHRRNLVRIDLDLMDFVTTGCYRRSFSSIFRLHESFVYLLSC